jgi:hypothetical protein
MTSFTDEQMLDAMSRTRDYTVVLLEAGPQYDDSDETRAIVWEHGRRNFDLRAAGQLNIVCPIRDESALCGVAVFSGTPDEVRALMEEDPGVRAGVFTYRIHPSRSFPGDSLAT